MSKALLSSSFPFSGVGNGRGAGGVAEGRGWERERQNFHIIVRLQ